MIGGLDVEGGVLDHRAQQVDRGFAALWQLPASREKVVRKSFRANGLRSVSSSVICSR